MADNSARLMPMRVWPGRPYPLGATWDGMGVNFALFAECVSFRLSARARDQNWELLFDTSSASMTQRLLGRLAEYPLQARSVAVLCLDNPGEHSFR